MIEQIKKVIVHDAVIESILSFIEEKDLQPGARLPSERTLAAGLNVSRNSVRGALKALEASGMIDIRHGGGAYLLSRSGFTYRRYDASQLKNLKFLRHLLLAREMIEERVVVDICPLISAADIQELYEMEEKQLYVLENDLTESEPGFETPNLNFELRLTAVLGNPVISDLHERLQTLWKQTYKSLDSKAFQPRDRYEQHKSIIQALAKHDAAKARDAMVRHNVVLQKAIEAEIEKLEADNDP
ncbi:MAG: GntR family transcriptional regulator [Methylobacteriaceae bacterium]|nr:GntR family transcriptional regulator [Methylobacteriaceae bacterium]